MNYEQKYKEALKKGRKIHRFSSNPTVIKNMEDIFPELRESEDERIRKAILHLVQHSGIATYDGINWLDMVSWLEKQGEQKPIEQDTETHDLWVYIREWNDKFGRLPKDEDELAACINYVMKRQKPTDKIEPKFKVGDWIVQGHNILKIRCVGDKYYCFETVGGYVDDMLVSEIDSLYHLWTIQDANDGDVLATKKGNPFIYDKYRYNNGLAYYYAGLGVNKELTLKSPYTMLTHFGKLCSVSPATKEQRDLLFQKMKETGYEWDAEKKELKKIEQESAWSEEDEKILKRIDNLLYSQCTIHGSEYEKLHNWLNSIKPNHWKPSEEQMEALNAINNIGELSYVGQGGILVRLYNELKKL